MDIVGIIVATVFIILGIVITAVPARSLLEWDRKTGYLIYLKELERSGDKQRAIAKAAVFYKAFGICMAILGAAFAFMSFLSHH
jgi:hypothetical protein